MDPPSLFADGALSANAVVVSFADHDAVMQRSSLVVGHGGHGTTKRALKHGRPIVGVPATGGDEIPITQLLERWMSGRALPGDAQVDQIREAAREVMDGPDFRAEAQRRSSSLLGPDGAHAAARAIEGPLA